VGAGQELQEKLVLGLGGGAVLTLRTRGDTQENNGCEDDNIEREPVLAGRSGEGAHSGTGGGIGEGEGKERAVGMIHRQLVDWYCNTATGIPRPTAIQITCGGGIYCIYSLCPRPDRPPRATKAKAKALYQA